ncbi:MAG: hypothetical protein A2527_07505 [Candidatus Lambdaproteobacteria bacterium RIFOXYD2_FULL_50_16]|uniref:TMEM205-like domain-containing protein n=1 Tax=Candidatus Lambdaproteobacteria bacterium RIFOXYD2_FULL_50_16 TaxID=1817772 RepID=A0A1F6GB61_9PROT|nr:MAG: hypothetical protein A2527_07505 [Candidatus Lambdaproteobacteria bacterium RIFOXYD2_FULL_50_16]
MNQIFSCFFRLSVALWFGGMACFAFLVTPLLFANLGRDEAAKLVGTLFTLYYPAATLLSLLALIFFLLSSPPIVTGFRIRIFLLVISLLINGYQQFSLFPRAAALQVQIGSFETTPKEDPNRQAFRSLHIQANSLGLVVMISGGLLVLLGRGRKR